jgi:hypothetical protein
MSLGKLRAEYLEALREAGEGDETRLNSFKAAEEEHDRLRQEATAAHMRFVVARTEITCLEKGRE